MMIKKQTLQLPSDSGAQEVMWFGESQSESAGTRRRSPHGSTVRRSQKKKNSLNLCAWVSFFSLSSPFARPRSDYFSVDPMTLAFNVSLVLVPPKAAVLSSAPTPRESN